MVKDSIYRPAFKRRELRVGLGFDYKDKILKKSMSSQLFGINTTIDTYLSYLNKIVYEWVESVKQIKIFANPAVDKYEDKIN
jgi:hypothetical protein